MGRRGEGRGWRHSYSEVTHMSTPAIAISSSSSSSSSSLSSSWYSAAALWPFTAAAEEGPLALLCAPLASPESAGVAARSEGWSRRVAEGEWW